MKRLSHYVQKQAIHPKEIVNWSEYSINDSLTYSYRSTVYDQSTYPSSLHYHDYYELVIFEEGEIHYVCESKIYTPQRGDIILIPPQKLHMSRIVSKSTRYTRHVFYLFEDAFSMIENGVLSTFLKRTEDPQMFTLSSEKERNELMRLLSNISVLFGHNSTELSRALGFGYITQIFYLLNQKTNYSADSKNKIPESILSVQRYIDQNFAEISTVSDIAEQFFYSREYISRLFKKHFDTTILDYVTKRRIARAQAMIADSIPITEVCYKVGFGSMSGFIRAFRSTTGMTPSEYRSLLQNEPRDMSKNVAK